MLRQRVAAWHSDSITEYNRLSIWHTQVSSVKDGISCNMRVLLVVLVLVAVVQRNGQIT